MKTDTEGLICKNAEIQMLQYRNMLQRGLCLQIFHVILNNNNNYKIITMYIILLMIMELHNYICDIIIIIKIYTNFLPPPRKDSHASQIIHVQPRRFTPYPIYDTLAHCVQLVSHFLQNFPKPNHVMALRPRTWP